jgi:mannan endo-1,4-beta-mannosidase
MRIGYAATAAALALATGIGTPAVAETADSGIVIGASGGASTLRSHTTSSLATHKYGKLSGKAITDAAFVNIETTVAWSQVASGSQDSNIVRWANALKGKGKKLVSFSHEPMAKQNSHWGNASSFIAAFKHVENVFKSHGATNVEWVWNVTSNSFRVKSSSSGYGAKWYPGDSYVDDVAGEAYNLVNCGQSSKSFASKIKEILAFAKQHHKKLLVAEFASNRFSGRADWIKAATSYISANRSDFRGAFYYQSTNRSRGCDWQLNTSAEYSALRSMATAL